MRWKWAMVTPPEVTVTSCHKMTILTAGSWPSDHHNALWLPRAATFLSEFGAKGCFFHGTNPIRKLIWRKRCLAHGAVKVKCCGSSLAHLWGPMTQHWPIWSILHNSTANGWCPHIRPTLRMMTVYHFGPWSLIGLWENVHPAQGMEGSTQGALTVGTLMRLLGSYKALIERVRGAEILLGPPEDMWIRISSDWYSSWSAQRQAVWVWVAANEIRRDAVNGSDRVSSARGDRNREAEQHPGAHLRGSMTSHTDSINTK